MPKVTFDIVDIVVPTSLRFALMDKMALFSSVCELLTGRCTPELERVQAELGAHLVSRRGPHSRPAAAGRAGNS